MAVGFVDRVLLFSNIIVVGTVREFLPARWNTPTGLRPENPHTFPQAPRYDIITPVRLEVEQVGKGSYPFADCYFAVPGGRIGQDCSYYKLGTGSGADFALGQRFIYFATVTSLATNLPSGKPQTYFTARYSYSVSSTNIVKIGPEWDIVGNTFDSPARTLSLPEVMREIALLLANPLATPIRKR